MRTLFIIILFLSLTSCQAVSGKSVALDWDSIVQRDDCASDMSTYFECQSIYSGNGASGGGECGDE